MHHKVPVANADDISIILQKHDCVASTSAAADHRLAELQFPGAAAPVSTFRAIGPPIRLKLYKWNAIHRLLFF